MPAEQTYGLAFVERRVAHGTREAVVESLEQIGEPLVAELEVEVRERVRFALETDRRELLRPRRGRQRLHRETRVG